MTMVQEMLRVPAGSRMIILSRGIDGITHNALSFIDLLRAYPHPQIVLVFAEQVTEAPRSLAWRRYNTMDYIVCPLKILVDHQLGRLVDSKCTELCERWHSINKTKKGIGSAIEQHCKKGTTRGRNNPIAEMKNILGTMVVPCSEFNCMQAFWSASSAHMHWCQTHQDKCSGSSKCLANGCLYVAKGFEQAVKHCAEHEDLWAKVSEDRYTKLICPLKDCTWFIIDTLDSNGFFSKIQGHSQSHKPNHKPKQVKGVKPEKTSDKCKYTCNIVSCGKSKPATAKASWMDWRRRHTAIHLKLLDKHLRHRSQRATGTKKGRVECHLCNTTFMVAAGCLDDHIQWFHRLEWIQSGRQILAEMETNGD